MGTNGDEAAKAKATAGKLARILRLARIREAAEANKEVRKRSAAIERARQARVRARRNRSQ